MWQRCKSKRVRGSKHCFNPGRAIPNLIAVRAQKCIHFNPRAEEDQPVSISVLPPIVLTLNKRNPWERCSFLTGRWGKKKTKICNSSQNFFQKSQRVRRSVAQLTQSRDITRRICDSVCSTSWCTACDSFRELHELFIAPLSYHNRSLSQCSPVRLANGRCEQECLIPLLLPN